MKKAVWVSGAIALAALGFGLWSVLAGQVIAALVTAIQFVRAARLPLTPPRRLSLGEIGQTGWYGVGTKLDARFDSASHDAGPQRAVRASAQLQAQRERLEREILRRARRLTT